MSKSDDENEEASSSRLSPSTFSILPAPPALALIGLTVRSIVGFMVRLLDESREEVETPSGRGGAASGTGTAKSPVDNDIPE